MMRRAPSVPPELPGYTFVRLLGSGGFSDVFLYEQKLPRRRVAVKVLLTEGLSAGTRAAFTAEANLMAQLSAHPYIVTIFQADVAADDRPYFVMEYCAGPSLAETYKRQPMPVPDVLRTGIRLASAIATAHAAGILHRDIKPANVLTNDYGWPALTDFGISSTVDDELLPVHTGTLAGALAEQTGGTAGTSVGMSVPWSPPEMFEDDPQPDVRSDVFALAATLHTVLAGRTPFEVRGRSNGTLDLIGRIERGAISPIDRDDIPRSLTAVLRRGMATSRDDRFATVVDFARALQRVELELGYAPTALDVPNLAEERAEPPAGEDGDETRVRSIPVIEAQPPIPPVPRIGSPPPARPAAAGGPAAGPGAADETVVRRPVTVDAQPVRHAEPVQRVATPAGGADVDGGTVVRTSAARPTAPSRAAVSGQAGTGAGAADASPPPTDAEPVAPAPEAARNRLVVIGASVAAALVVVAVAVGIGVSGGTTVAEPTPEQSGDSALSEGVPTPDLVSKTLEGSEVVFTVANPDPVEGDTFRWQVSNSSADEPFRSSTDGRIAVPDPGQEVCVQVLLVRDGRQSSNPLNECYS